MTENERVKELRKSQNLTLAAFGKRIGISKGALSQLENGKTNPSDQTRHSICREFGVREEWLRDGAEPMEAAQDTVSLDDLIKGAGLEGREAETIKKLLQIFCSLEPRTRRNILERFDEYFGAPDGEAVDAFRAEADEIAAQLNDEKEATEKSSASHAASFGAKEA